MRKRWVKDLIGTGGLWLVGAIVLFCALYPMGGCTVNQITNDVGQQQGQVTGSPASPSPSPSAAPGCAAVASVSVAAHLGGTGGPVVDAFKVAETSNPGITLDATPRDQARTPLDARCHGSIVDWKDISGTASCKVTGETGGFTPGLSCSLPGDLRVCATVSTPGGTGCLTLKVNP